jgi:hypothetical protein
MVSEMVPEEVCSTHASGQRGRRRTREYYFLTRDKEVRKTHHEDHFQHSSGRLTCSRLQIFKVSSLLILEGLRKPTQAFADNVKRR